MLTVPGVRRCGKSTFSLLPARELNGVNFDDGRLIGASCGGAGYRRRSVSSTGPLVSQSLTSRRTFAAGSCSRAGRQVIVTGSRAAGRRAGNRADREAYRCPHVPVLLQGDPEPDIYRTEDIAMVKKEFDGYLKGSGFPEFPRFGPHIVRSVYESHEGLPRQARDKERPSGSPPARGSRG